ncbi:MAG: hypothetical protein MUE73_07735 [Planctomycetes bacterium]|nr:hypothetical protein [Planctomycetota bacterium]
MTILRPLFAAALLLAAAGLGEDLGTPRRARIAGRLAADGETAEFRLTPRSTGSLRATVETPGAADLDLALLDDTGAPLAAARRPGGGGEILSAAVRAGIPLRLEIRAFSGAPASYRLDLAVARDPRPGPVRSGRTRPVRPMATARCFHAAADLPDGGAIVAGGTARADVKELAILYALASTEVCDARGRRFRPGPPLSAPRFGLTGTTLSDGRVLLAGGDLAGSADLFDPDSGGMTMVPLSGGTRFLHTATLLSDGRVLLAGGVEVHLLPSPGYQALATSELFDPKTGTFSPGPPLRAPRLSHAACLLPDGRVLLTGGEGRSDSEVVDPGPAFASLPGPPLAGPRDDHTATLLPGGRVLVCGGQGPGGESVATAEVLDPGAGAFRTLDAMLPVPRSDHVAILLPGGEVLLLGGERDPGNDDDEILRAVDLFRPGTETFGSLPPLAVGRDDHRVVRLRSGRVLVTGGEDAGSLSIPDAELYDPR